MTSNVFIFCFMNEQTWKVDMNAQSAINENHHFSTRFVNERMERKMCYQKIKPRKIGLSVYTSFFCILLSVDSVLFHFVNVNFHILRMILWRFRVENILLDY